MCGAGVWSVLEALDPTWSSWNLGVPSRLLQLGAHSERPCVVGLFVATYVRTEF